MNEYLRATSLLLLPLTLALTVGCALKVTNTCPSFAVDVAAGFQRLEAAAESTSSPRFFLRPTVEVTGRDASNPGFEDTIRVDLTFGEAVCLEWDGIEWSVTGSEPLLP